MHQVIFKPRAEKFFARMDKINQQRMIIKMEQLRHDPFQKSNIKKISGTERGYRLRMGRYRILFSLYSDQALIEAVDIFIEKGKNDYLIRRGLFAF